MIITQNNLETALNIAVEKIEALETELRNRKIEDIKTKSTFLTFLTFLTLRPLCLINGLLKHNVSWMHK
jgi:hypothetical protein